MRFATIVAVAAALVSTAPATAADAPTVGKTIVAGEKTIETFEGAPVDGKGRQYRCYILNTERGSQWRIHISQKKRDEAYLSPALVAGTNCFGAPQPVITQRTLESGSGFLYPGTWYATITSFSSGGGAYAVSVVAPADKMGEFHITATQIGAPGSATSGLVASATDVRFAKDDAKETASTATPRDAAKYQPGELIRDCPDCPAVVVVPHGSFTMGSNAAEEEREGNEGPAHRVTFANAFAIGQTEVTFEQYDVCVGEGACAKVADGGWGRGKRPVVNVTWSDARAYAAWLGEKTGQRYFLPSEAEWEYAARAGTKTPWNTGSAIVSDDANILNAFKQTVPVGGFPANAFGLKDVHGNVWEWVLDCAEIGYFGVPDNGGAGTSDNCKARVARGGAFNSPPKDVRSARRLGLDPATSSNATGFRVARAL